MLDNQLFAILKPLLINGMKLQGYDVDFLQAYQPTQQGVNSKPTFYCAKIPGDTLVGSPKQKQVWTTTQVSEFTASIAGKTLTVTALASGTIGLWQSVTGAGIPDNTIITGLGTGSGGAGTYFINQTLTIASADMIGIAGEVSTQSQQYESTFQLNCLSTQNPAIITQPTASDLLNFAAAILQSQTTISYLQTQNVGILKITKVRNLFFKNDKDRFQASPSFDFALTHKQDIVTSVPVITTTEVQILEV